MLDRISANVGMCSYVCVAMAIGVSFIGVFALYDIFRFIRRS